VIVDEPKPDCDPCYALGHALAMSVAGALGWLPFRLLSRMSVAGMTTVDLWLPKTWIQPEMTSFASMLGLVELLVHWLSSPIKWCRRLEAASRHQVNILRRQESGRLRPSNADQLGFVGLDRLWRSVVDAVAIIGRRQ